MIAKPFDLIGVGHIVHEMIYFPDRTVGPVLGSPPAYSLVAAARQGIRCGLVTKIGDDFPGELLATFDQAAIDIQGVTNCEKSTCSHLIYDKNGNKEIQFPSRADVLRAADVPQSYQNCRMLYVCTMQDDVELKDLAKLTAVGNESAIDLGGYGGVHMSKERRNQVGNLATFALEAAAHFDFVKASDEDCRSIFGDGTAAEFAQRLLVGKTQGTLITLGSDGVMVGTQQGIYHIPALPGNPIDATGGGETFMGGFLAEYLRCGEILPSAVFGSATALCVIEKTGGVTPDRMPTEQDARSRISVEQPFTVIPSEGGPRPPESRNLNGSTT